MKDLFGMELDPSTLSAADSHARTYRRQGRAQGLMARGRDYGLNTPVSLAKYDLDTSSWRTSQLSLAGGLEEYSETFPRSGMMRSGTAYQLPPLVPLTAATESGYWPTPVKVDTGLSTDLEKIQARRERIKAKGINGNGFGLNLGEAVRLWPTPNASSNDKTPCLTDALLAWEGRPRENGAKVQARLQDAAAFWPTPRAMDARGAGPETKDETLVRRANTNFGLNLSETVQVAERKLFPTPTRSMHKGSSAGAMTRLSGASRLNDRLDYAVEQGNIKTGRLNPLWVAWLMGFPIEWASFAPTEMP